MIHISDMIPLYIGKSAHDELFVEVEGPTRGGALVFVEAVAVPGVMTMSSRSWEEH